MSTRGKFYGRSVHVASISGGKDSVAMCLRLCEERYRIDEFVFCDTGMEFPECYDALDRFERLTGRKVTRLKSQSSFEFLMCDKPRCHRHGDFKPDGTRKRDYGYGWPHMLRRWCTKELKQTVLRRWYKGFGDRKVFEYVGIAYDEPLRVRRQIYPLVRWRMREADCLAYCKDRGFYRSPSAYDRIGRMSCYCCPLMNQKMVAYLIRERPEIWENIRRLERLCGEPWKEKGTEYFERKVSLGLI